MAAFPEALYASLTAWYPTGGVKRPVTHAQGFTARLNALEKAFGGKQQAAAAAGIGRSTWGMWSGSGRSKRPPSAASRRKVEATYAQLLRDRAAKRTAAPRQMLITAVVVAVGVGSDGKQHRYVNKTPKRLFRADQVASSSMAAIVAAWRNGGTPREVADVAVVAIKSSYGQEFQFEGSDVRVELQ